MKPSQPPTPCARYQRHATPRQRFQAAGEVLTRLLPWCHPLPELCTQDGLSDVHWSYSTELAKRLFSCASPNSPYRSSAKGFKWLSQTEHFFCRVITHWKIPYSVHFITILSSQLKAATTQAFIFLTATHIQSPISQIFAGSINWSSK